MSEPKVLHTDTPKAWTVKTKGDRNLLAHQRSTPARTIGFATMWPSGLIEVKLEAFPVDGVLYLEPTR